MTCVRRVYRMVTIRMPAAALLNSPLERGAGGCVAVYLHSLYPLFLEGNYKRLYFPNITIMQDIVSLETVYKIYQMGDIKVTALNGISMTIKKGEFVAVKIGRAHV